MEHVQALLAWLYGHGWHILVASAVVNLLLMRVTPERLVQLAEQHPRTAAGVALVRAAGFDPVLVVRSAQALLTAKAAQVATEAAQLQLAPDTLRTGQAGGGAP